MTTNPTGAPTGQAQAVDPAEAAARAELDAAIPSLADSAATAPAPAAAADAKPNDGLQKFGAFMGQGLKSAFVFIGAQYMNYLKKTKPEIKIGVGAGVGAMALLPPVAALVGAVPLVGPIIAGAVAGFGIPFVGLAITGAAVLGGVVGLWQRGNQNKANAEAKDVDGTVVAAKAAEAAGKGVSWFNKFKKEVEQPPQPK